MKIEFIDAKTAGKKVGVGPQLLRQLAREGKIPSYRLSRRTLRFDLTELKSHMKRIAGQQHARAAR
jgi:excisionase family DNA binding protein